MKKHAFTPVIIQLLESEFGKHAIAVFEKSELLRYLNTKTKSASKGSKSRGSFANHYAIYVLVEDYVNGGFAESGEYSKYEGAKYTDLFTRQRSLPFGQKLQNHALNHRMNQEFAKQFPDCEFTPILRNTDTSRYWFNEKLLKLEIDGSEVNISNAVLKIVDAYVAAKKDAFEGFIKTTQEMLDLEGLGDDDKAKQFIEGLIQPNVDARVFEIVSFSVLKAYYSAQSIFWGWESDDLNEEALILYKTGRTNANDGGIDFVMKPLGRFFQVTETTDVKKYFLDIDKVQRFPITFVVKSQESTDAIKDKIREQADSQYGIEKIVERYMGCVEEIINIPVLLDRLQEVLDKGRLNDLLGELLLQAKVEFHYYDDDGDETSSNAA